MILSNSVKIAMRELYRETGTKGTEAIDGALKVLLFDRSVTVAEYHALCSAASYLRIKAKCGDKLSMFVDHIRDYNQERRGTN